MLPRSKPNALRNWLAARFASASSPGPTSATLVKLLGEDVDGLARERIETNFQVLEYVKRRLGRIWNVIETTDASDSSIVIETIQVRFL